MKTQTIAFSLALGVMLAAFTMPSQAMGASAPLVTESPPGEVVSTEGREVIHLAPAADGSPRSLITMGTVAFPEDSPDSLYKLPRDLKGMPEGTVWTYYVLAGKPMFEPPAEVLALATSTVPSVMGDDDPALGKAEEGSVQFQAPGGGSNDKAGVHGEATGCDARYWWGGCSDSWDNTHATGVLSSITFQRTTLNSDQGTAHWPGLVTASNDFIQVGYANTVDVPGANVLFVQVYRSGHFGDACNTTYVFCGYWTPSPGFVTGSLYTFSLKSGYNGNANTWGFYLDNTLAHTAALGSSDSGNNVPYSFVERVGAYPRTATFPQTYWDCGLCMWKAGWSGSASPRHATYATEASPSCPGMGSYKPLVGAEYWLGPGTGTSCPTAGTRLW